MCLKAFRQALRVLPPQDPYDAMCPRQGFILGHSNTALVSFCCYVFLVLIFLGG